MQALLMVSSSLLLSLLSPSKPRQGGMQGVHCMLHHIGADSCSHVSENGNCQHCSSMLLLPAVSMLNSWQVAAILSAPKMYSPQGTESAAEHFMHCHCQ
jgi:hypothetical protein